MKARKFLWLAMGILVFSFASCSDDDDKSTDPTGISLDKPTLTVEVDGSGMLTATLTPSGSKGTIVWESSDESIATVSNSGMVNGHKVGTVTIAASCGSLTPAICEVTVVKKSSGIDKTQSLSGSNYYVISLDAQTFEKITDKVVADYRPDDVTKFLYYWNGYNTGTISGLNFYDHSDGWESFVVAPKVDWSGAGYVVNPESVAEEDMVIDIDMRDIMAHPADYYLHIGIKSSQDVPMSHAIILYSTDVDGGVVAALGDQNFDDNGKVTVPFSDFTRDGEWNEIEIPMTYFTNKGFSCFTVGKRGNVFAFLSGNVSGRTLDLDAVFIYKKAK